MKSIALALFALLVGFSAIAFLSTEKTRIHRSSSVELNTIQGGDESTCHVVDCAENVSWVKTLLYDQGEIYHHFDDWPQAKEDPRIDGPTEGTITGGGTVTVYSISNAQDPECEKPAGWVVRWRRITATKVAEIDTLAKAWCEN